MNAISELMYQFTYKFMYPSIRLGYLFCILNIDRVNPYKVIANPYASRLMRRRITGKKEIEVPEIVVVPSIIVVPEHSMDISNIFF